MSNSRTYSSPIWSCISDDWRRGRATESERLSEAREACQSGESRDRIPSEPRRSIDGGDGGDKRGELSSPLHRRTVIVKRKRREGGGEGVMALAAIMSSASICTRPALSGEALPLPLTPPACSLRSVAAIITLSPFSCVEGKRRTHPESSGRSPMSGSALGVSGLASSSDRTGGGAGVPGLITLVPDIVFSTNSPIAELINWGAKSVRESATVEHAQPEIRFSIRRLGLHPKSLPTDSYRSIESMTWSMTLAMTEI